MSLVFVAIEPLLHLLDSEQSGKELVAVADDVTFISVDGNKLQDMLHTCSKAAPALGLTRGLSKCKVIVPPGSFERVELSGKVLDEVPSWTILGF